MSLFGKFASVSLAVIAFAATDSARAGSSGDAIHLQCDGADLAPFCAALGNALQHAHPERRVTLSPDAGKGTHLTVRFSPTRQSRDLLAGFLVWQDSDGNVGQGPEAELSVMDSVITDDMLGSFAGTLVQHSDIPL